MKKICLILAVLLLAAGIFSSGCLMKSSSVFRTNSTDLLVDDSTRTIQITSEKFGVDEQQEEIKEKLENLINNGSLNIIKVQATYYRGNLDSAKISYNSTGPGEGNLLRAIILLNNDSEREEKIKEISGSKKYHILQLHKPTRYEDVAEIYYTVKE